MYFYLNTGFRNHKKTDVQENRTNLEDSSVDSEDKGGYWFYRSDEPGKLVCSIFTAIT